jgi:hypothetical protein
MRSAWFPVLGWTLLVLSTPAACVGHEDADAGSAPPGDASAKSEAASSDDSPATQPTGDSPATDDASPPGDLGVGSCTGAPLDVPPLVDAAACGPGQLEQGALVTIVTPDEDPSNPTLASSPSGDRFLAVWTDGGGTINNTPVPETIWSSLVAPDSDGAAVSAAIELTGNGNCPVATWNGTDFTVVWGDASGLRSQEVDATGALVGSAAQVLSKANASACPASLIATPGGLAVAWYEGQSAYTENVGLIGQNGALGNQVLLDTIGPGVAPNAALAQLQGQTYVAFVEWPDADSASTVVSQIDWSGQKAISQAVEPGFFGSFLAAGDQLWLTAGYASATLYAGTPGAPLRSVGTLCNFASLATDACGRLVQLGTGGATPAGVQVGFFARPIGWTSPAVSFGNVTGSAIAGAASSFGLLWYARVGPGVPEFLDAQTPGSLSFTTLSWGSL